MTDSYLPTGQVERIQKSKGVHVEKHTSMRVFVLRMNNTKPPLDNVKGASALRTPSTMAASSNPNPAVALG